MLRRASRCLLALVAVGAATCPAARAAATPLAGRTIVLDPGHNGANARSPSVINRLVAIGQGQRKPCNTTGTATDGGYAEAAFNWDVAVRARRVLRRRGATVVLTRADNHSVGPCVDERARIANRAHADATVSIHADGAPASGYGFHVIEPALIRGLTDDIFAASHRLAVDMRAGFHAATHEPYSTYLGHAGIDRRGDLGGLRLADVPAIFIETGNMRNASDARKMVSGAYRLRAARGIADGIQRFLAPSTRSAGVLDASIAAAASPPPFTSADPASIASTAAASAPMFTQADRTSFARLQRSLGGTSGVAVSPLGTGQPTQVLGSLRSAIAWSTSKVPVAMAVLQAGGGRTHAADLRAAITASDNASAERLWSSLGDAAKAAASTQAELRAAGDGQTQVQGRRLRAGFTAFGQTVWSLDAQVRFTAGMSCLAAGREVLDLMAQIVPGERWGLGVRSNARFKGGWGPGTRPGVGGGYLDRQLGIATVAGKPLAIAIATLPRDGSHATGSANLTTIAKWVFSHVDVAGAPAKASCR